VAAPDLVQRQFRATRRDGLWVADIPYVPTATRVLYVAVMLDVWSRRIVGWGMAEHRSRPGGADMAIAR
jgi:putative transposase